LPIRMCVLYPGTDASWIRCTLAARDASTANKPRLGALRVLVRVHLVVYIQRTQGPFGNEMRVKVLSVIR
jgi:hypothetical protein